MNLTAYLHLVWKEYRAVRAFWLSMVVLVVLLEWLISAVYYSPTSVALLYTFGLAAPAFFAIGATGAAFAMEREEGTFDFLQGSPIKARQVFASKLGVATVATASMFVVLWGATLLFTYPRTPASLDGMLGLWIMAAAEAIAWGTLFSLLTARPLVAICLALAATSTVTHLLAWSVAPGSLHEFEFAPYLTAVPRRALVVAVVLAGDVYQGLRWLHGGAARVEKARPAMARRKIKELTQAGIAESTAVKTLLIKPDRGAMLAHLLWQHWRQSAWLMGLMAGLVFVTLLMMAIFSSLLGGHDRYAVVPMVVFAALLGCCVFLPDQERRRYRFFVEHNIPPRYVWFTRQAPWIVTLLVSTFVICLVWLPLDSIASLWNLVKSATEWDPYHWQRYGSFYEFIPFVEVPPLAIWLAVMAVSYAAGQWTSMLVRSGIMAGFFGLLLGGVLCGWVTLMYAMQVSFLWSVVPIPLVLLWATWLRAPDWAAENTRWSARGRAAAAVLAPALALVIAVPIYRVRQVPLVNPGFDPTQFQLRSQVTPESKATAALYRQAAEHYVDQDSIESDEAAEFSGRVPTQTELKWLHENASSLALVLEASSRPTCSFGDPSTLTDRPWLGGEYRLIRLILTSGRQLGAEGKLDEALDRYFSALRVVSHWADYALQDSATEPQRIAQRVFSELADWAAQKGQTAERIGTAIKRLQTTDAGILHMDDLLKSDYIVARRAVWGDLRAWMVLYGDTKVDRGMTEWILWGKLMPWERYRGERMLNLITEAALARLQQIRFAVTHYSGAPDDRDHWTYQQLSMRDSMTQGPGTVDLLARNDGWNPVDEFKVDDGSYADYSSLQAQSRQKAAWLSTTYALDPGIGLSGTFAAAQMAEFEAHRRATLLLLALEAHRIEHGALPKSLDELVGPYLDALPLDPYSGLEFDYFPAGLPQPATPLEAAELTEKQLWPPMSVVAPGKPCIWCSGPRLLAGMWQPYGASEETAEKPKPVLYYGSRDYRDHADVLLPYRAWRRGNWFPIPDQAQ